MGDDVPTLPCRLRDDPRQGAGYHDASASSRDVGAPSHDSIAPNRDASASSRDVGALPRDVCPPPRPAAAAAAVEAEAALAVARQAGGGDEVDAVEAVAQPHLRQPHDMVRQRRVGRQRRERRQRHPLTLDDLVLAARDRHARRRRRRQVTHEEEVRPAVCAWLVVQLAQRQQAAELYGTAPI